VCLKPRMTAVKAFQEELRKCWDTMDPKVRDQIPGGLPCFFTDPA